MISLLVSISSYLKGNYFKTRTLKLWKPKILIFIRPKVNICDHNLVVEWNVCAQSSVSLWNRGLYVAHQAPLSMEYSRQEYLNGLSFPPPADVPDSGIIPASLTALALAGEFFTTRPPGKPHNLVIVHQFRSSVLSWPLKPHLQRHRQLEERSLKVQRDTCKVFTVQMCSCCLKSACLAKGRRTTNMKR